MWLKYQTIFIKKEHLDKMRADTSDKDTDKNDHAGDYSFTYTADFGNGIEARVIFKRENGVVNTDAVLLDRGSEVCCPEGYWNSRDNWILDYNNTEYNVEIKEDPGVYVYKWNTMSSTVCIDNYYQTAKLVDLVSASKDAPEDILDYISRSDDYKFIVGEKIIAMADLYYDDSYILLAMVPSNPKMPIEEIEKRRRFMLEMIAQAGGEGGIIYEEENALAPFSEPVLKGYYLEDSHLTDKKPLIAWR